MSDKITQATDMNIELDALNLELESVSRQIRDKEAEIEFLTKPSITLSQYEILKECVDECINDTEWAVDNFETSLSMDYNNTVEVETIDFNCKDELIDDIMRHVTNVFAIDDSEGNDSEDE